MHSSNLNGEGEKLEWELLNAPCTINEQIHIIQLRFYEEFSRVKFDWVIRDDKSDTVPETEPKSNPHWPSLKNLLMKTNRGLASSGTPWYPSATAEHNDLGQIFMSSDGGTVRYSKVTNAYQCIVTSIVKRCASCSWKSRMWFSQSPYVVSAVQSELTLLSSGGSNKYSKTIKKRQKFTYYSTNASSILKWESDGLGTSWSMYNCINIGVSDGFWWFLHSNSIWVMPEAWAAERADGLGAWCHFERHRSIVALRCCTLGTSCFKLNRQLYQLRPVDKYVDKYVDTYCARLDVCWCFTCDSRLGSKFAQVLWQVLPWLTQEVERWPVLSAQCCNLGRFFEKKCQKMQLTNM